MCPVLQSVHLLKFKVSLRRLLRPPFLFPTLFPTALITFQHRCHSHVTSIAHHSPCESQSDLTITP